MSVTSESLTATIFRRGGSKQACVTKSAEDEQADKLGELAAVWEAPRRSKDLSAAIWRPDLQAAEVAIQRTNLLTRMGFDYHKKQYLHVEEAVYLVDRASLLLFVLSTTGDQQLLSLQEAFQMMLEFGVSADSYAVYSNLMRNGYIVRRHPSLWSVDWADHPCQVWGTSSHPLSACAKPPPPPPTPSQLHAVPAILPLVSVLPAASVLARGLPNAHQGRPKKRARLAEAISWWPGLDAHHPWLGEVADTYLSNAPRAEVASLVESKLPSQFPKLRPALPIVPLEEWVASSSQHQVVYDVYNPNAKFSRRVPDSVKHHVCMCNLVPSIRDMRIMQSKSTQVVVKYAHVDCGDVTYYNVEQADITSLLQAERHGLHPLSNVPAHAVGEGTDVALE